MVGHHLPAAATVDREPYDRGMNWERVESSRWWGRALLVTAVLLIFSSLFMLVEAPNFTYDAPEPSVAGIPIAFFGYAGMFFGLAWMWRIYRAPTKVEGAHWRYHDR